MFFNARQTTYRTEQLGNRFGSTTRTRPGNVIRSEASNIYLEAKVGMRCAPNVFGFHRGFSTRADEDHLASIVYSGTYSRKDIREERRQNRDAIGPECVIEDILDIESNEQSTSGEFETDRLEQVFPGDPPPEPPKLFISGGTYVEKWNQIESQFGPGQIPEDFEPDLDAFYRYLSINVSFAGNITTTSSFDRRTVNGVVESESSSSGSFVDVLNEFTTVSGSYSVRGLYLVGDECDFFSKGVKVFEQSNSVTVPTESQTFTDEGRQTGVAVPEEFGGPCPEIPAFDYDGRAQTLTFFRNASVTGWSVL